MGAEYERWIAFEYSDTRVCTNSHTLRQGTERPRARARARVTASRDGAHGRDERRVRADERGEDESPAREVRDATDIAPRRRDAHDAATTRRDDGARTDDGSTLRDSIRRAPQDGKLASTEPERRTAERAEGGESVEREASVAGRATVDRCATRCDAMRTRCDKRPLGERWDVDSDSRRARRRVARAGVEDDGERRRGNGCIVEDARAGRGTRDGR